MKKITGIILAVALMLSCVSPAFAATKYEYTSSADYVQTQGTDGWYYMYSTAKVIGTYKEMTWGEWGNIWKTCYAYSIDAGKASSYIAEGGLQKPNLGSNVAKIWVAPMTGNLHLTSTDGVKKNESKTAGCTVAAKIYKADANDENAILLWETEIAGTDNIGVNYNIDVDVNRGDKIYFELSCVGSDAHGECRWDPKVSYNQAVKFSRSDETIDGFNTIEESDTLKCTFYDKNSINEDMIAYLALYNEEGGMVSMASESIAIKDWTSRELVVDIPISFGQESYEGWSADLLLLTAESGRCYSVLNAEPFSIK